MEIIWNQPTNLRSVIQSLNSIIIFPPVPLAVSSANSHPYIIETAVIPISNNTNSKRELKISVVKVKNKALTHKEVSDFLYHNLAYFQVPRYIEFREEIPKGPSTEISKSILKKEWEEMKSRANIWDTQIQIFLEQ